jgi:hypothetical protein
VVLEYTQSADRMAYVMQKVNASFVILCILFLIPFILRVVCNKCDITLAKKVPGLTHRVVV